MRLFLSFFIGFSLLFFFSGCTDHAPKKIIVLSGRGLQKPMEEIRTTFIKKHNLDVHIVYAGSVTLLDTIQRSNMGDVFVPGSSHTLKNAGDMIVRHVPVSLHTPVVAISKKNPKKISSFDDLAGKDLRLGIAHAGMAALGRTSEQIFTSSPYEKELMANVIIKAQNVSVLLAHLVEDEIDAAILWSDMLRWPESQGVTSIEIPAEFNHVKTIHAGLLRQSKNPAEASLFVEFMAREGAAIFQKHGFGALP